MKQLKSFTHVKALLVALVFALTLCLSGCAGLAQSGLTAGGSGSGSDSAVSGGVSLNGVTVYKDGEYTSRDEVALYIHEYGKLPKNYITKKEAQAAGWEGGMVELRKLFPGKSIGGSSFGNREGKLPRAKGRTWKECDIDPSRTSRGAKRIIYSNDGLIYYTGNHYETFQRLY